MVQSKKLEDAECPACGDSGILDPSGDYASTDDAYDLGVEDVMVPCPHCHRGKQVEID